MCRKDEGNAGDLQHIDVNSQSKKSLVKMVNKLWNQDQITKLEERGLSCKADQKRTREALAHRIVVMEGAASCQMLPREPDPSPVHLCGNRR